MAIRTPEPLERSAEAEADIVPALPAFTYAVGRWVTKWYSIDGPGYMIRASRCKNAYFVAARVSGGHSPTPSERIIRTTSGRKYLWGIWAMSCGTGFEPHSKIPSLEPDDVISINKVAYSFSICSTVAEEEDAKEIIEMGYLLSPTDPDAVLLQSFVDKLSDDDIPDRMGFRNDTAITGIVYAFSDYLYHIRQQLQTNHTIDNIGYMTKASQCKNAFFVAARILPDFDTDTNSRPNSTWGIWVMGCGNGDPKSLTALSINDAATRVSICSEARTIKASLTLSDPDAARLLSFATNLAADTALDNDSLSEILPAPSFYLESVHVPRFYSVAKSGYTLRVSACRNAYLVATRVLMSDNDWNNHMCRYWDTYHGTNFLGTFESLATHLGVANIWGIWAIGSGNGFLSPSTPPGLEFEVRCRPINDVARSFSNYPNAHSSTRFKSAPDVARLQSFVDNLSSTTV